MEARQGEERVMTKVLRSNDVDYTSLPLRMYDSWEAADILYDGEDFFISWGGRTTEAAADALVDYLENKYDLRAEKIPAIDAGVPQHLLGHKQFVAPHRLLSRDELSSTQYIARNCKHTLEVLALKETEEVIDGFAMNIVVVAPNVIIMPEDCPETKEQYEKWGMVCLTTPMSEIHKMAGGLTCCTCALVRDNVFE
jgi:N-dimethylarginine dimethylaminohydrolase